ncbi:hypothetical protein CHGG_02722 [Chaetomium globosum CBS 148.51]|uniref:Uncharacterized protein n=1 Tax=Chaetomium globosum (strain ATCC 6205 / CBS 148.51 / DSM 1962 / NBRC 6347 / NRRL 1970) TaxID=306901 RepID=Q2HAN2_CHAGB|nr:uncharacterized protein CHGG_02722 [Chaetomium globosum CBS 148.51]EAQ90787.1 hypothetical protein CHGG_02722 [Chaetomium globosum CBS 148.51]
MEPDGAGNAGRDPDTRAVPPNNRFTSPLVINSPARRRSLFSRPKSQEGAIRPTSSGSISDTNAASPNNTKIPRPAQQRPITLSDAYRMAEEEEAAQGSPSPAPRLWRSRRESTGKKLTKPNPSTLGVLARGGSNAKPPGLIRDGSQNERPGSSQQSDLSDSTFDEKLRQYAQEQAIPEEPSRRSTGLFSRSRLGTKIVETGRDLLVRRSSRSSLEDSSSPRAAKAAASSPSLLRRLSGIRREPSDAYSAPEPADWAHLAEHPDDGPPQPSTTPLGRPAIAPPDSHTSNKSFAWQADADFTAGDFQVSNSPPVAIGRSNTKIDEIRALEAELNGRFAEDSNQQPESTLAEGIGAVETWASPKLPSKPLESGQGAGSTEEAAPEGGDRASRPRSVSRASVRLDELRSREIETLSRRALATARLDEFRERNIAISRSPSPDIARKSSREPIRAFSPLRDRLRRREDETVAATEQTEMDQTDQSSLGSAPPTVHHPPAKTVSTEIQEAGEGREPLSSGAQPKDDTNDVIGLLIASGGGSSASAAQVVASEQPPAPRGHGSLAERMRQRRSIGGAKSDVRPTVGFTGLSRSSSAELRVAKRGSFVHSDSDPTERIEGEMKLFAAQENQSEKGSLRALSPDTEEEVPAETPKPTKVDPLTQPTPRVVGAFVETPATVKVEKPESSVTAAAAKERESETREDGHRYPTNSSNGSSESSVDPRPSLTQGNRDGTVTRQQKRAQSSKGDRVPGRSSSLSSRRRARSLSRSRRPLANSAKPPTVRDDLLEIQRANQMDDSTLDDLADLLNHQDHLDPIVPDARWIKPENNDSSSSNSNNKLDGQKELEAYDRMSRSLETGLLGIQIAKQGIQRLEDKVAQADVKKPSQHTAHDQHIKGNSPSDATVTYVAFPLPRLWHRRPKFRFTLFGLGLFLLSLWYIAESWMCFRYCKPEYCYPGAPCDWSSDDPVWGYAIPVKLDQWVAGGQGREFTRQLGPEVADWLADLRDAAIGVDITAVDTSRYNWEQKRRYRRRLARKGLAKPFVERPEDKDVFNGWKSVREANAKVQSAQEMGYGVSEDESIGGDQRT